MSVAFDLLRKDKAGHLGLRKVWRAAGEAARCEIRESAYYLGDPRSFFRGAPLVRASIVYAFMIPAAIIAPALAAVTDSYSTALRHSADINPS